MMEQYSNLKDVYIDGVERPVQRSSSYKNQEMDYSGKKKRHTKKNIVITSRTRILALSSTDPGSVHDLTVLRKAEFLEGVDDTTLWVDSGFQ